MNDDRKEFEEWWKNYDPTLPYERAYCCWQAAQVQIKAELFSAQSGPSEDDKKAWHKESFKAGEESLRKDTWRFAREFLPNNDDLKKYCNETMLPPSMRKELNGLMGLIQSHIAVKLRAAQPAVAFPSDEQAKEFVEQLPAKHFPLSSAQNANAENLKGAAWLMFHWLRSQIKEAQPLRLPEKKDLVIDPMSFNAGYNQAVDDMEKLNK